MPKASVQKYLKINEIKDGVVTLKNGSMRSVILVSSINFALKGEEEKNAIISSFQGFLNSFDFPIQIMIRSKKLEMDEYLENLDDRAKEQTNLLLRDQITDYTDFVRRMLEVVNIMDKDFFVVVPYYPAAMQQMGFLSKFGRKKQTEGTQKKTSFEDNKLQLLRRVDQVTASLATVGLKSVLLNTEELIELFYSIYNPTLERTQKLLKIDELGSTVIQKKASGGETGAK